MKKRKEKRKYVARPGIEPKRVDDGLVLVCWCISQIILSDQFGWMDGWKTDGHDQA